MVHQGRRWQFRDGYVEMRIGICSSTDIRGRQWKVKRCREASTHGIDQKIWNVFTSQIVETSLHVGIFVFRGVADFFEIHSKGLYKYPNDSRNHLE